MGKVSSLNIPVCVWTDSGYKQVAGVNINQLGFIELVLDDE